MKTHLDFNIANLLYDARGEGRIWLLDIESAGLSMPSLFDLINLALNEVYADGDLLILDNLLNGRLQAPFAQAVSAAVTDPAPGDGRTAIFVNFVMRESARATERLFGISPSPERTLKHWKQFDERISWW